MVKSKHLYHRVFFQYGSAKRGLTCRLRAISSPIAAPFSRMDFCLASGRKGLPFSMPRGSSIAIQALSTARTGSSWIASAEDLPVLEAARGGRAPLDVAVLDERAGRQWRSVPAHLQAGLESRVIGRIGIEDARAEEEAFVALWNTKTPGLSYAFGSSFGPTTT